VLLINLERHASAETRISLNNALILLM